MAKLDQRRLHLRDAVGVEIGGDATWDDPIHHQPMAEARIGATQHALAQDAALRVHDGKRGIVADRSDVAEVIGQPFELGHQRAQKLRARCRFGVERGLDRVRKRQRIGDGAVAGGAAGEPRGVVEVRTRHQRLDAFMHVAQPLLEPHDGLAVGGEAEMSGLDDAGMHRADRDLVQVLALGRQERVGPAR